MPLSERWLITLRLIKRKLHTRELRDGEKFFFLIHFDSVVSVSFCLYAPLLCHFWITKLICLFKNLNPLEQLIDQKKIRSFFARPQSI